MGNGFVKIVDQFGLRIGENIHQAVGPVLFFVIESAVGRADQCNYLYGRFGKLCQFGRAEYVEIGHCDRMFCRKGRLLGGTK